MARAKRRARPRRSGARRDLSRALAALLAALAVGAAGYAVSGPFPIREVAITGTGRLDAAAVREASRLQGANVFRASAREAEALVGALPAVRRARVTIQLPDRAVVAVEERVPVAVLAYQGGRVLVDVEGVAFPGGAEGGVPVLEDETAVRSPGERIDAALVQAVRDIAAREPAYFGRAVQRIRNTTAFGLVAVLEGGTEIRIGAAAQVDLKLETARQIVLTRAGKRLDYVDVRNRENPVFFPRD